MRKSFLIIKLGAIGDVIMSLPMLSILKSEFPDCRITWVVGKSAGDLLTNVPEIDELITLDDSKLLNGNKLTTVGVILGLWRQLIGRHFDRVIIGHANIKYRLLALPVRANQVVSFGTSPDGHKIPAKTRHHSTEYLRLATGINGSKMASPQHYPMFDKTVTGRTIGLAPGGAKNLLRDTPHRRWPIQHYVALTKALLADGYQVSLFGGPTDLWVLEHFNGLNITNHVATLTILETAKEMSKLSALVLHDTGPAHLASLSNRPMVVLFGPTDPRNFKPLGTNVNVITTTKNLACQPCYDGLECSPCENYVCMSSIEVQTVRNAIEKLSQFVAVPIST